MGIGRLTSKMKLRQKCNAATKGYCQSLIHCFFSRIRTLKLSNNYVSRQLEGYLTVKNTKLLSKSFAALKGQLLE